MMMDPSADQIRRMLSDLVAQAGIGFSDVDYINAHGTGTVANDEIESRVIAELFGTRPLVNSTKSLIGHTIGAGGAIETVVTALSIARKTTHACRNLDHPVRDLNFVKEVRTTHSKSDHTVVCIRRAQCGAGSEEYRDIRR